MATTARTDKPRERESLVFHSWSARARSTDDGERGPGVYVTTETTSLSRFLLPTLNTNLVIQYLVVRAIQEQPRRWHPRAQHGYEKRYRAPEMILDHSLRVRRRSFQTAVPRPLNTPCEWPNCTRVDPRCSRRIAAIKAHATSIRSDRDPRRWPNERFGGVVHFFDLPLSVRFSTPERRRGVSTRAREFGEHHCFRGTATIAA